MAGPKVPETLGNIGIVTDGIDIRIAGPEDALAIAELHVETFRETHGAMGAPSLATRGPQWQQIMSHPQAGEFCLVVQSPDGSAVGFARCFPYLEEELGEYKGHLNKIYLLRAFQKQGLGRRLIERVAAEFLGRGIDSMLLFGDEKSAANGFYEHMGGRRLITAKGEFHGGYGWTDLRSLGQPVTT